MNLFLILAFLFFMGSVIGWIMELLFRRFISNANPERKWINPGLCTGPYLPLYGFGLCFMYLVASLEKYNIIVNPFWNKVVLFAFIAICMTALEYVAGVICLKAANVRLWDYSDERGNIQGIICPKFSLIWTILGAIYYFFIHPYILDALNWLSLNLAFSFVIGLFFGVFLVDVAKSVQLVAKLKKYADESNVIIQYEALKVHIRRRAKETQQKYRFFRPFQSDSPLSEHLRELKVSFESRQRMKKPYENENKNGGND